MFTLHVKQNISNGNIRLNKKKNSDFTQVNSTIS